MGFPSSDHKTTAYSLEWVDSVDWRWNFRIWGFAKVLDADISGCQHITLDLNATLFLGISFWNPALRPWYCWKRPQSSRLRWHDQYFWWKLHLSPNPWGLEEVVQRPRRSRGLEGVVRGDRRLDPIPVYWLPHPFDFSPLCLLNLKKMSWNHFDDYDENQ